MTKTRPQKGAAVSSLDDNRPQEHPLRRQLNDELHARKFNHFDGTGRFIRYVYFTQGDDNRLLNDINALLKSLSLRAMAADEKFIRLEADGFAVRVERHTEFMSLSLIDMDKKPKQSLGDNAFDEAAYPHLPFAQIKALGHLVFHAMWLEICEMPKTAPAADVMEAALQGRSVAGDNISSGGGKLYASFDIDAAGYSRIALMNDKIANHRMGRVIQRVMEMETYRLMALLSLPKVKYHSPALDKIEDELKAATRKLAKFSHEDQTAQNVEDADALLTQLTGLAADIEQIYSETSYRFSASLAYQDIVDARIASLKTSRLDGYQSIGGFLAKRMQPAMQSMTAFSRRIEHLSKRISRAGQLQRSQTELSLQIQNRDLLTSMNQRTSAQLRLQQTVEGLSLAALTYYGVGLVGYVAEGLPLAVSVSQVKAVSVPVIALSVYLIIRRVKRSLGDGTSQG